MADNDAQDLVKSLMADPAFYQKMAKKENDVWGTVLSDDRRNAAIKDDQKSAADLQLNRDMVTLPALLKKLGLKPKVGLSLACGNGRAERSLMTQGICEEFDGFDISTEALAEARERAAAEKRRITYQQADLNEIKLAPGRYDLVVTQNCLHHVLRLENLADQIHSALSPSGLLWIHDYIGETQFQHGDKRMAIANKLLSILPARFREDLVNRRVLENVVRRKPGTLISPFEAIRSAEIMPVFLQRFEVVEKVEFNSILHLVCPVGTRHHYAATEEGRAMFEMMHWLDRLMIQEKILTPCGGIYLLKPKP
jgi:2-polyprenyl-3-methyl-5-hydroxy-6-metoxy-1,4-benzoquinol methylase